MSSLTFITSIEKINGEMNIDHFLLMNSTETIKGANRLSSDDLKDLHRSLEQQQLHRTKQIVIPVEMKTVEDECKPANKNTGNKVIVGYKNVLKKTFRDNSIVKYMIGDLDDLKDQWDQENIALDLEDKDMENQRLERIQKEEEQRKSKQEFFVRQYDEEERKRRHNQFVREHEQMMKNKI